MLLTEDQLTALQNLAAKAEGKPVDWINIAAARRLTELGLAERNGEGWRITPAGNEALQIAKPQR